MGDKSVKNGAATTKGKGVLEAVQARQAVAIIVALCAHTVSQAREQEFTPRHSAEVRDMRTPTQLGCGALLHTSGALHWPLLPVRVCLSVRDIRV